MACQKKDNIIETATSAELLENVKNVNDLRLSNLCILAIDVFHARVVS